MLGNSGTYANKKRKKPVLKQKKNDGSEVVKSNPSKRHRDRLNGELDRLTDLLPFSEDVRTRLDKLSVLRLSVGYLRVKSYFKATMKNSGNALMFPGLNGNNGHNGHNGHNGNNGNNGNHMDTAGFSEGDLLLQALNGFVIVVTSEGLVFYSSATIKDYLGFHQSDVVHQSVYELIHTDDRAKFRQQLHFALNPPTAGADGDVLQSGANTVMYSPEQLPPENSSFLERSFVCRFRCLLDNSSGFLALKFQGRLKYLHGQSLLRDNRMCNKPQLALFAIAMPVQPPSIVEIRAKMLLFQTKHKLDFTPTGVDSRGKIVLGYSETELCMKGSGYQFIHAADMMYCAEMHIRMIKTGETGMTVFRLLSKSSGWLWVKSNAKLIYKGGRPEFIIANQRALLNSEGEEYLRQRRLQIPFNFTTGEGVLYNSGPTIDVTEFQFNKLFSGAEVKKDTPQPTSLVNCFLRQDEAVYTQPVERPLPTDQVFMDSRALVSIGSDAWQEGGAVATTGEPAVMKDEAKQSVMEVIDSLEKMAQSGDFGEALQGLEMDDGELIEWENALKRASQEDDHRNSVRSDLDSILANDVFDFIDTVLFKEKGPDASPPSCLTAAVINNNNHTPTALFTANQLLEPQLFPTPSPEHAFSPMEGVFAHQQDAARGLLESQAFGGSQKLSHRGPMLAPPPNAATNAGAAAGLPPLQQLQLQDIFSPSIELPELTLPDAAAAAPFQSCGPVPISHLGVSGQRLLPAALAANGQLLHNSVQQPNNNVAAAAVPGILDILPPLIPCNNLSSSAAAAAPNIPVPFAATGHCLQPWQQSQKLQHAGIVQNGHEPMPMPAACHGQTPESQTFPHAAAATGLWPRGAVARLNHPQQGGLACGQAASHNSCMFDQHFSSSGPAAAAMAAAGGGDMLALSGSSGDGVFSEQTPLQGSCCFQWSRCEPAVGSSAVNQENGSVMFSGEHALNIQHYLDNRQTQD